MSSSSPSDSVDNPTSSQVLTAHHVFAKYKELTLPRATLTIRYLSDWRVEVDTNLPALFVLVDTVLAGHWSDNGFHLFPGKTRTLTFMPTFPALADESVFVRSVKVSSLWDTYH